MDKKDFHRQLIERYVNNLATEEELEIIFHLIETGEIDETLKAYMGEVAEQVTVAKRKRLWPRITVAASILVALTFGGYKLLHAPVPTNTIAKANNDIAPGHNQATLTLSNGQKILLKKGMNGQLAQHIRVDSSGIVYQSNDQLTYNILSTKKGEASPFPVQLPDGTKVWLNAASTLTYPTVFNGKERVVKLTGEAYFEVEHNAAQPFKVQVKGQTIEDIGTEFNINAYDDEPVMTTTLISGSVLVNNSLTLKPGQQAKNNSVSSADIEQAIAWKEGKFDFDNADVPTVMRQIARWYNVDIIYQGEIPTARINGSVYRNTNVSNALKIVKLLGINYKIDGQKLIISNP